jgi:hypothetical protein
MPHGRASYIIILVLMDGSGVLDVLVTNLTPPNYLVDFSSENLLFVL